MKNDQTKRFYDLVAERDADLWYQNDILEPSIKEFVDLFPKTKRPRILELGCGQGHDSLRLFHAGADVVGVDYSHEAIEIAKKRNQYCSFYEMDFLQLDTAMLGVFDGVFACASLIHVSRRQFKPLLDQVHKIVAPGGYFFVLMKHGRGVKYHRHDIQGEQLVRTVHYYGDQELIKVFGQAGFHFMRHGVLAEGLDKENWRSYIFKTLQGPCP